MAPQALLAHPRLDAQAQHLRVERLKQHVGHAPGERLGAFHEVLGTPDQNHRQIEQLGVAADRGAQALQLVMIVAGGDQGDVEIVAAQPLERGIGSLGVGRGGGAAERGQDLDLVAARGADQQDADAVDRGHAGRFRGARDTELGEQGVAPPPLDLDRGQAGKRAGPRLQLRVVDRQHEHVVGAERHGVRRDRRRLVGGGDDDRQITRRPAGLDPGQQRHAVLDPGIDQHDIGALGGQRRGGALVAVARGQLAAPITQPRAEGLERLLRPLQHDDTGGLSHAHASP